jgi:hypothetical protein
MCVGKKTTLLQAEASACVSGLANVLYCGLAFFIFIFFFMQQKFLCHSVVCLSFTMNANSFIAAINLRQSAKLAV